jgi:septal ring factor EnvC (AmiA/AmiB activator)
MKHYFVKVVAIFFGVLLTTGFCAAIVQAQEGQQQQQAGKTIFDYKAELNLTDDQVKKIKDNLADLDKEVRVSRAKLTLIDVDLQKLMEKEGDMNEIKKKVNEAYEIQAAIKIADLEAARKINGVLKPDQLKKWREIQAKASGK